MEKVTGIGGFFFRSREPDRLSAWYRDHLGINPVPTREGEESWEQQAGSTAFAPFPNDSTYFRDPAKGWMLNFRVTDLSAMVTQLRDAGINVDVDPEAYPYGRFARLTDPEGNPIELWEPR